METLKKMQKQIGSLTGIGVSLPVGIQSIKGIGATHGAEEGLGEIAGQQGLLGTVLGATQVLGVTREAFNFKKKK